MDYKHKDFTEDELKQIAKDLYNGAIFTSAHLNGGESPVSHFLPLMFLPPSPPSNPLKKNDKKTDRSNLIEATLEFEEKQKEYEKISEKCDEYLADIGLIYAHRGDGEMPMAMNGYPVFEKCTIMDKKNTKAMFEFYTQYKEIRENADNF